MKSKLKVVIIIAMIVCGIVVFMIIGKHSNKDSKDNTSGSFYENMDVFGIEVQEDSVSDLGKAYLEKVNYEILERNEETMTARVRITVPVLADPLRTAIDSIQTNNNVATTEELQAKVEEVIMEAITHAEETRQAEIELPIIHQNGENRIVTNTEMYEFIYEDFQNMYYEYLLLAIGGETDETAE